MGEEGNGEETTHSIPTPMTKWDHETALAFGLVVAGVALQAYWTYATWEFVRMEKEMERKCDARNPYDWVVEWYNWGNVSSLAALVVVAAFVAWAAWKRSHTRVSAS